MARRDHGAAAEALEGLESSADRLSNWLEENIRGVAAAVIGVLLVAGLGAWFARAGASEEEGASVALAKAREDYLSAMGASPGALEVPELANREAATQIRAEYEARFAEVADAHAGTVAGTLAGLEAAQLAADDTRPEAAAAHMQAAIDEAPGGAVRGMALAQLGQLHEADERWSEAAEAYLRAADVDSYPLRGFALADAARTTSQAGDPAGALDLYERFEDDFSELELPEHQRLELLALRAEARE